MERIPNCQCTPYQPINEWAWWQGSLLFTFDIGSTTVNKWFLTAENLWIFLKDVDVVYLIGICPSSLSFVWSHPSIYCSTFHPLLSYFHIWHESALWSEECRIVRKGVHFSRCKVAGCCVITKASCGIRNLGNHGTD